MTAAAVRLTLRYFAGAGAAAGTDEEQVVAPPGTTTAALLAAACDRLGPGLTRVVAVSSVLVDGVPDRHRDQVPGDGATVDVLPPFAGG